MPILRTNLPLTDPVPEAPQVRHHPEYDGIVHKGTTPTGHLNPHTYVRAAAERSAVATALQRLGIAHADPAANRKAVAAHTRAAAFFARLNPDHPDVVRYRAAADQLGAPDVVRPDIDGPHYTVDAGGPAGHALASAAFPLVQKVHGILNRAGKGTPVPFERPIDHEEARRVAADTEEYRAGRRRIAAERDAAFNDADVAEGDEFAELLADAKARKKAAAALPEPDLPSPPKAGRLRPLTVREPKDPTPVTPETVDANRPRPADPKVTKGEKPIPVKGDRGATGDRWKLIQTLHAAGHDRAAVLAALRKEFPTMSARSAADTYNRAVARTVVRNARPREITAGDMHRRHIDEHLRGTRTAYHLMQIAREHPGDPAIAALARKALAGGGDAGTVFAALGQRLAAAGSAWADEYNWDRMGQALQHDRAVSKALTQMAGGSATGRRMSAGELAAKAVELYRRSTGTVKGPVGTAGDELAARFHAKLRATLGDLGPNVVMGDDLLNRSLHRLAEQHRERQDFVESHAHQADPETPAGMRRTPGGVESRGVPGKAFDWQDSHAMKYGGGKGVRGSYMRFRRTEGVTYAR